MTSYCFSMTSLIKFGDCGIPMKEVIKTLILERFEKKNHFYVG